MIPAPLRRRFGLVEGSDIIAEETPDGILIRPALTVALEMYSPERRAEFLLMNAVGAEDYEEALKEVRRLGVDPESVPHSRP